VRRFKQRSTGGARKMQINLSALLETALTGLAQAECCENGKRKNNMAIVSP
jgi:post-segregation antitoxin (ccd killing protein)